MKAIEVKILMRGEDVDGLFAEVLQEVADAWFDGSVSAADEWAKDILPDAIVFALTKLGIDWTDE